MGIIKSVATSFVVSAASVIGMCAACSVWAGGLDDYIQEKTRKIIGKKNGEEEEL